MKFRFHRGGLSESLETTIEVSSVAELAERIRDAWHLEKVPELSFHYMGFDDRIGWDTWNVLVDGSVAGMSDGIHPMGGWVPVAEHLPNRGDCVLGYARIAYNPPSAFAVREVIFCGEEWIDPQSKTCHVTHWMPMPAPPQV